MINEEKTMKYCRDDITKIENYAKAIADTTQTWDIHHRLELTLDGEFANSKEELKRMCMYYHRPYFELIFLTHSEHLRLHKKGKNHHLYGKQRSDETKKKIGKANKGQHRSEETKLKISEAKKGRKRAPFSEDTKRRMSEAHRGIPFTDEHRRKLSESGKARWATQELR